MSCQDCNQCTQQRLDGAFVYLTEMIEQGMHGQARHFFGQVIDTEAQKAREDERKIKGENDDGR